MGFSRALLGVLAAICLPNAAAVELELSTCQLTGSLGFKLVDARCGNLTVPENSDEPNGASVALFVAVVPSLNPEPKLDAFTVINGGPGGSSVSLYVDFAAAFAGVLRERDIVLVDQRGTGRSKPLGCPELQDVNEGLAESLGEEAITAATIECLDQLDADPRFFTTSVAVRDLELVREALGYQSLNLYGVSYGTRVALHYLRRYPEATRSIIIDGVVPPELALGGNVAINAQTTLTRLFERCLEDGHCRTAFPDAPSQFLHLSERLKAAPIKVSLLHPVRGTREEISLGYPHLAIALRLMSYTPETAALIPLVISEATSDNYVPLAAQALRLVEQISSALMIGMHNAVVCSEDAPYYDAASLDRDALDATYLGAEQYDTLTTMCAVWPVGVVDDDIKEPVTAAVPTLILSGEEDPITPPAYGDQVAKTLENSLHIVAPGQGHGVVARGCVPGIVTDFVETASTAELDAACVDRLGPRPFFINLMGPAP